MDSLPPDFRPGQRWASVSEPELGLGVILAVDARQVRVRFPAADEERVYAVRNAPLSRIALRAGERAQARDGGVFVVERVAESAGLLTYFGAGTELPEGELLDRRTFDAPDRRLLAAEIDSPADWRLRQRTLLVRAEMLGSPLRGFCGARIELLPHQLAIAAEVAGRHGPRVLLADEVGLGKTIEAGLVFHRLLVSGRISRVLVLAPPQLVHQWLVELWRRFNTLFTVVDQELCRTGSHGSANPFVAWQTMLASLPLFTGSPERTAQAANAGIDLLVVDEAHHLAFRDGFPSPEYAAVERLAESAGAVLLLTATPSQLGEEGHFARLRLLDPARFADLDEFRAESGKYRQLAATLDRLLAGPGPDQEVARQLTESFPGDAPLAGRIREYLFSSAYGASSAERASGAEGAADALAADLVDRHGTGRVLFRNRRKALRGFPPRVVMPAPLPAGDEHRTLARFLAARLPAGGSLPANDLSRLVAGPCAFAPSDLRGFPEDPVDFLRTARRRDPRLAWLADLLTRLGGEKVVLIASHRDVVLALAELLPERTTAPLAIFHENLAIVTRDRNAAWFADPGGARLLLCSEIGSEGRNFQFAHHLVLYDLPLEPAVLEQRIGRLDRIGQRQPISIHVPFLEGTPHAVLHRWYADGLGAFEEAVPGADSVGERQRPALLATAALAVRAEAGEAVELESRVRELVSGTRLLAAQIRTDLEEGRDRLLDWSSRRASRGAALAERIAEDDRDTALETWLVDVLDSVGFDIAGNGLPRGYLFTPDERTTVDGFPGIPAHGLSATFDRRTALSREDLAFLSRDHPVLRGAVDLVLDRARGTSGFVAWPGAPTPGLALEAVFVLAATAPADLQVASFLPPTPIRVLVDSRGKSLAALLRRLDAARLEPLPAGLLERDHAAFEDAVPRMLDAARAEATATARSVLATATAEAESRLGSEARRLRDLAALNPSVKREEVAAAEAHADAVAKEIDRAEMRLDSVRLVVMGRASERF